MEKRLEVKKRSPIDTTQLIFWGVVAALVIASIYLVRENLNIQKELSEHSKDIKGISNDFNKLVNTVEQKLDPIQRKLTDISSRQIPPILDNIPKRPQTQQKKVSLDDWDELSNLVN